MDCEGRGVVDQQASVLHTNQWETLYFQVSAQTPHECTDIEVSEAPIRSWDASISFQTFFEIKKKKKIPHRSAFNLYPYCTQSSGGATGASVGIVE